MQNKAFETLIEGTGLMIYLDNSATTKPHPMVVEKMTQVMQDCYYNASAAYAPAMLAEREIQEARALAAGALGVEKDTIVFTSGGTESDNLAILGAANAARGRHMITTAVEHPAVIKCVEFLEEKGFETDLAPVSIKAEVDVDELLSLIRQDTFMVSFMHVNNEVGSVSDIADISKRIKRRNPDTLVHVDGVQAFLRIPTDLYHTDVDLYSASAHKVHGPKGVGFLYIKDGVRLKGVQLGGGQENDRRSGTYNTPGIAGFGAAIKLVAEDKDAIDRMVNLRAHFLQRLVDEMDDVHLNGPVNASAPHVLSMSFLGVRAETLLHALEEEGIYVGLGSACAARKNHISHVLQAMNLPKDWAEGTVRFSLGCFNTQEEIDRTADEVKKKVEYLRQFKRR